MVERAEHWRWGSLWARRNGDDTIRAILSSWPVERPKDWVRRVNTPLSAKELRRVRTSLERGQPYGEDGWVKRTARDLGLEHTLRAEGRPSKRSDPGGGGANNELRLCFAGPKSVCLAVIESGTPEPTPRRSNDGNSQRGQKVTSSLRACVLPDCCCF